MKTFNEKLDDLLIPTLFGSDGILKEDGSDLMCRVVKAQKSRLSKTRQSIIDLICETAEEAKPKTHYITYIGSSTITGNSTENSQYNAGCDQYQDNLINIVRGK